MQTRKYWAAIRLFVEDKGNERARTILVAQGLGWTTAQKIVARKYKLSKNGKVLSAIKPILEPYMRGGQ